MKTRVIVVEDPMFREQLVHLIEKDPELEVCGETENVPDGVALVREKKPQVVILDITLKSSNGSELLKDLRANGIEVPVLLLSMHEESLYAERALRAGARGYITKSEASSPVLAALREVLRGEVYLDAKTMARIVQRAVAAKKEEPLNPIAQLSDRELEVFDLLGRAAPRARSAPARIRQRVQRAGSRSSPLRCSFGPRTPIVNNLRVVLHFATRKDCCLSCGSGVRPAIYMAAGDRRSLIKCTQSQSNKTEPRGFHPRGNQIVVAIIALLGSIAVPGFMRARKRAQASRVLNDLRLIDSAIDQYAIENNKITGAHPVWSDLKGYMKKGGGLTWKMPR